MILIADGKPGHAGVQVQVEFPAGRGGGTFARPVRAKSGFSQAQAAGPVDAVMQDFARGGSEEQGANQRKGRGAHRRTGPEIDSRRTPFGA